MKKSLLIISTLFALLSCKSDRKNTEKQSYSRWVGDISQNEKIDDVTFKVCNGDSQILQYFNLGQGPVYTGEKSSILNTFKSKYETLSDSDQNGFIRLRFIVNCEGKTGRFRVLQSDENFEEMEFDNKIVNQLVTITKGIEKWGIFYRQDDPIDYYMYLIFKIKDGQLTEILP